MSKYIVICMQYKADAVFKGTTLDPKIHFVEKKLVWHRSSNINLLL